MCKITKEAISMKVKFNFNLEAWIQDVEIEADSIEEAENKLYGMTVQELINALSKVDDKSLEVVFPYDYGVNENNQPLAVKKVTEFPDCVVIFDY